MAIDTAAKRNSAIATRRLPWFRRFAPIPDGSVTQADRQQVAFVYGGIAAEESEIALVCGRAQLRNTANGTARLQTASTGTPSLGASAFGTAQLANFANGTARLRDCEC